MTSNLQKLFNSIEKSGEKIVIHSDEYDKMFVLMGFDEYETLVGEGSSVFNENAVFPENVNFEIPSEMEHLFENIESEAEEGVDTELVKLEVAQEEADTENIHNKYFFEDIAEVESEEE